MPCFLHADLDAFYASVEQLDNPEFRGKPVIVGGLPGDRRSVTSAASYEARRFGVHSAMPIAKAHKLCPEGIFVKGRMGRYHEKSEEIMAVFSDFTPDMQQLSIDEAFLDITGTEGIFGPPKAAAKKLKERVRGETGLTVSIGAASNKYVAKIASGMSKPDGLFVIEKGEEENFMRSLPVEKIWGAGEKTQELFRKFGLKTCEDIYRLSEKTLHTMFGNALGAFLHRAVRGESAEEFSRERGSHSISAERTFAYDLFDEFEIETAILEICETLMWRLLSSGQQSATVSLKIRYGDFTTETVQETFMEPVLTLNDFYKRVLALFHKKYRKGPGKSGGCCPGIRLIGAGFMNVEDESRTRQGDLFDAEKDRERRLEESILRINARFPEAALRRGRSTLAGSS
jgi:DNA polymerase-4